MLSRMQRAFVITFCLVPLVGHSSEGLADVAAYINAMWFAEEYNEHCPGSRIDLPMSEAEMRRLSIVVDGENIVDRAAQGPVGSKMDYRKGMQDLARESVEYGCESELALLMRSKVEQNLTIPELIKEHQKETVST